VVRVLRSINSAKGAANSAKGAAKKSVARKSA
jgi:hypothetical protein